MTLLDTGILVGALLERHPEHTACLEETLELTPSWFDAHVEAAD